MPHIHLAKKLLETISEEIKKLSDTMVAVMNELDVEINDKEKRADELEIIDIELKRGLELNIELEKRVQERTKQYEVANKDLEAFTFSVSHDLRAPLRAVNSYAQILLEDYTEKLDDDGKTMLQNIQRNGIKMGRLIDDLLDFSRLGRKEMKKRLVDMNELTKKVTAELNHLITNHAKIIISDLPNVQGDYDLLYQAMMNLISNAIKYTGKKSDPLIEIFAQQKESKTIFTIKDNGAGFDMQYASKLFGVFQRLHSEEEFEGNGIGLSLVQRIINKHGGKVWGKGKVNEGATFYFTLN